MTLYELQVISIIAHSVYEVGVVLMLTSILIAVNRRR